MPAKNLIAAQIIGDLLERFPKSATMTLAKKAYKENPGVWTRVELARSAFRRARGAHGKARRAQTSDKTHFRTPHESGDPFPKLPAGLTEYDDWRAVQIDGPLVALILADVHIPYHDRESVTLALQRGLDRGADLILLNGDFLDCFALKSWETDPRKRDFPGERRAVIATLDTIREAFPKARIVYKMGNHEERYERYMTLKCAEFLDVPDFQFASVFKFGEYGIEEVREKRPIRLGKLNVIHGHEYRFSISNPVNPARGVFLRGKNHCVVSHFHQTSQHSENTLEGNAIACWSTGCLSDLHPSWCPINKWNRGSCIVEVDKDGAFKVDNFRIIKGRIYE